MPPENRKPATCKVTGFQGIDQLPGMFDVLDDKAPVLDFQAFRVQQHQPGISLSAARAVAELCWRAA